jgi:hypothetical protein
MFYHSFALRPNAAIGNPLSNGFCMYIPGIERPIGENDHFGSDDYCLRLWSNTQPGETLTVCADTSESAVRMCPLC